VERLTDLAYLPKILPDDDIVTYRDHAEGLLRRYQTARADAIDECAAKAKELSAKWAAPLEDDLGMGQASGASDVAAALEQLKGEGK